MKKIVIVLLILIICISSISIIVFMNRKDHINNEHNSFENKQTEIIKEDITNENINENNEDNAFSNDNSNSVTSEDNKESNLTSNSNVINKESTTTTKKVKESVTPKVEQTTTTKTTTSTTTKKNNPWDAYGVTEDEYYNKPMYSWERVDFSIERYGSEANCRRACLEYGDNYEPYLNGEVAYHCSTVNSRSGRYLGEYFSTERLN